MGYIQSISDTMTTDEYFKMKEQIEIDRLFDEAIKEAQQKDLEEINKKEHEEYMLDLFTKVGDLEAELSIMEDLLRKSFNKSNVPTETINDYKKQIKILKGKYTKTRNELEREIDKENNIKNNGK